MGQRGADRATGVNAERLIAHGRALGALLEQVRRFAATERALHIAGNEPIALERLAAAVLEAPALKPARALAHWPTLNEVERRYIAATLNHVRGNQTEAAKLLGISRKALWEKRKRYGLE